MQVVFVFVWCLEAREGQCRLRVRFDCGRKGGMLELDSVVYVVACVALLCLVGLCCIPLQPAVLCCYDGAMVCTLYKHGMCVQFECVSLRAFLTCPADSRLYFCCVRCAAIPDSTGATAAVAVSFGAGKPACTGRLQGTCGLQGPETTQHIKGGFRG
jgi:hypothetical protein